MTDRNDFQAHLDANPDDWEYRLVYADWLEEQGDPFCETQRWMVANGKCPVKSAVLERMWMWVSKKLGASHRNTCFIGDAFFDLLASGQKRHAGEWTNIKPWCCDYPTRHAAELDLHNALVKAGAIQCALIEEVEV